MRFTQALLCGLVVGCGQEVPDSPVGVPADTRAVQSEAAHALELSATQEAGRQLFNAFCWTCHGLGGRGNGPTIGTGPWPPNFMSETYAGLSASDLAARLRPEDEGGPGTSKHMLYVRSLVRANRFADALSYIPALAYPAEIPGSALRGREKYTLHCQLCHGVAGAGDGELGRTILMIKPADFTQDTLITNQDWKALIDRIRMGGQGRHTAMPPFGSYFTEDDIWDLVAYIAVLQPGQLPSLREETGD